MLVKGATWFDQWFKGLRRRVQKHEQAWKGSTSRVDKVELYWGCAGLEMVDLELRQAELGNGEALGCRLNKNGPNT